VDIWYQILYDKTVDVGKISGLLKLQTVCRFAYKKTKGKIKIYLSAYMWPCKNRTMYICIYILIHNKDGKLSSFDFEGCFLSLNSTGGT